MLERQCRLVLKKRTDPAPVPSAAPTVASASAVRARAWEDVLLTTASCDWNGARHGFVCLPWSKLVQVSSPPRVARSLTCLTWYAPVLQDFGWRWVITKSWTMLWLIVADLRQACSNSTKKNLEARALEGYHTSNDTLNSDVVWKCRIRSLFGQNVSTCFHTV